MLNIFKKNTIFGRNTNSDLPLYYDNISVEGNTTQESRSGKNLLKNTNVNSGDYNYWSGYSTFDEITRTLTRITTATTESFISHRLNGLKSNTTYTLSLYAKSNGYVRSMDLYCYNQNTQGIKTRNAITLTTEFVKYTYTFTTASDVTYGANSMIRIDNNGSTQDGTEATLTVKDVMLVEGTDTEYEDYGTSPSPDYPSELVSVGYENLLKLDSEFVVERTTYGITKKISNDGGVIVSGTPIQNNSFWFSPIDQDKLLLKAGTYTMSASPSVSLYIYIRKINSNTKQTISTNTFTVNEDFYVQNMALGLLQGQEYNETFYIQITKGSQAHSYIPYGKYGIEVKTNGKNLFKGIFRQGIRNSTSNANRLFSDDNYYIEQGKTYIFSTNWDTSIYRYAINISYSQFPTANLIYDSGWKRQSSFTFTASVSGYLGIAVSRVNDANFTPNEISSYQFQLEEGTQATAYEPYVSNTNLITLNQPLRSNKDGAVKDLLYIKNGMLYVDRKIGSVVLDGINNKFIAKHNTIKSDTKGFYQLKIDNKSTLYPSGSSEIGMSNYFKFVDGSARDAFNNNNSGIWNESTKYCYVILEETSLSNANAWLSTHNTEVQYVLATPTIETYELDIQPMIFDSLGYGTLSDVVSDPLITEELNGSYILELEYMKNGKFAEYLVEENIIKAHGEPFSIYSVEKDTDEKIKILAKHWVINEWDKDFILDSAPTDLAAQNALAWIQQRSINHSDISISGDCTATSTARYVRKNMLSAIFKEDNSILTRFGGELSYNKNNVSVNKHRGSLSGLTIRQGKNLTGAKYYLDFSTVTTRLVPVGKDGLMLDEVYVDSPLINNYATPIIRKVEVNTTSKDELRSYCNKLYENGLDKPTVSIKIDFIELSKTDEYKQYSSLETAHLGDEVIAYIPSLNLNVSTRIVKTVYNDNLKRITALELGSVTPNIATSSVNVEKNLQKQVEQLAANDSLILDEAKEEASNLIKHPFGGYIYIDDTTGNMYIMDTNDINTAQNVWRWGLGGLGFSSTGVNGTYGIAMTQDGKIVADYIKSGTLQSVTIKATNGTVGGYKIGENKLYAETYSSYNFDSSDLTAIRNYLMDEGSLSDDELIKYDIDGNGVVNSRDYVLIRNFIELGVTKNKSAKIIMQTGNNIFENAYILQDANENDILNINFNGFMYDHPNNGKFNLSGSKLTLTDINNNSMTISPDWLPKSVLSNWYSTSSTTLTDAKKHKLLVILGKPTSSSGIVSLIIPTDALSTSNQQFQCADESKYVAFNVRYNNDDVIITGAGRSSDGSILSAWTLL